MASVRDHVCTAENVTPDRVRLLFSGQLLTDGQRLTEKKIQQDSVMQVQIPRFAHRWRFTHHVADSLTFPGIFPSSLFALCVRCGPFTGAGPPRVQESALLRNRSVRNRSAKKPLC